MITRTLLLALATAGIVHTVYTSVLFNGLRVWAQRIGAKDKKGILSWLARGLACSYCFTYWVGAALSFSVLPLEWSSIVAYFAAVWLAQHSAAVYGIITSMVPFMSDIGYGMKSESRR